MTLGRSARRAALLALTATAALAVLPGCTDVDELSREAASQAQPVDPALLPPTILDLAVTPEPVVGVEAAKDAFVDRVGLFGMRKGPLLQATLQTSKFNDEARPTDPQFQQSVLQKVGGSEAKPVRMGDTTVFFTTAAKQTVAIWFRESWVYILAMRDDYGTPRNLTRAALEVRL